MLTLKQLFIMLKIEAINSKIKHVDIRVHYTREIGKENKIYLKYIKSENNLSDEFIKY